MTDELFADLALGDILGDVDYPIQDLENFNPDAAILGPPFVVATFATYGVARSDGLDRLEQALRSRAQEADGGKFNKTDVWYSPIAPPPGAWDYRCRNCRFFTENEGEEGGSCALVGHDGDPMGGESINPDAWCSLWMPEDGVPYLSYLKNRLEGEGE